MLNRDEVARLLGMADREIGEISDSPAGEVIESVSDGVRYILVSVDCPDGEGKTGLMYLTPPHVEGGYRGDFPVYVPLVAEFVGESVAVDSTPVKGKGRK